VSSQTSLPVQPLLWLHAAPLRTLEERPRRHTLDPSLILIGHIPPFAEWLQQQRGLAAIENSMAVSTTDKFGSFPMSTRGPHSGVALSSVSA
jgi:hypothetical protein